MKRTRRIKKRIRIRIRAVWTFIRPYLAVSKLIAFAVLLLDFYLTQKTLSICLLAIENNYTGGMAYLTALIGMYQAMTATVLSCYFSKSKAENTKGGITYDSVINTERDV